MHMIKSALAALGINLIAATAVHAGDVAAAGLPYGGDYQSAALMLSKAETVVTLVRKTRNITLDDGTQRPSDLRVSLVVIDHGSSTDVSPSHDIYIAMFNDVEEHGIAFAIEPVAVTFGFSDVERTAPGLYDVMARTLNTAGTFGGCPFTLSKISVDARQLSVNVRQAKGLGEFSIRRYGAPIGITEKQIGCD